VNDSNDSIKRANTSDDGDNTIATLAADDDGAGHRGKGELFGDILERRVQRRSVLRGMGALGVGLVIGGGKLIPQAAHAEEDENNPFGYDPGKRIGFNPIAPSSANKVIVPEGYQYSVILKWGDPLFPGTPPLDLGNQSGATRERQFGFNCDFIGWYPLPYFVRWDASRWRGAGGGILSWLGAHYNHLSRRPARRALLAVNHEYTSGNEMFPSYDNAVPTNDQVEAEIAAHGMSVVEVELRGNEWRFVMGSPFNRRITGSTPIEITGPLSGHQLLRTTEDPDGKTVLGMLNNCAGGKTPWGTVLTCEENFDQYFANFSPDCLSDRIAPTTGASERKWENVDERFNLALNPQEYNRFGYVDEIDPYDSNFVPKKRTALGRFKHEGAVPVVARDKRMVVYSGDDARFEYVYKFVSDGKFDPLRRDANMDLLDHGKLYVAKFNDDGTGAWLPLPNDPESVINTRGTADSLGATKMDRPEDVDVSPVTGKVYVAMTKNKKRGTGDAEGSQTDPGVDAANPRDINGWGHIIEISEGIGQAQVGDAQQRVDHTSTAFRWEMFMLCGDPAVQGGITDVNDLDGDEAYFAGFEPSQVSPIAAPDNIVFDKKGNLWIATDG